ncbi:MAG: hypothetical protein ACO3DH_03690 [Candidatus Kapaibacteriota bacterium]
MMSSAGGQSTLSAMLGNSVGLTQSLNCGILNPALLGLDNPPHYGMLIQPNRYGIKEFTQFGICGMIPMDTALFMSHGHSQFMKFEDFTSLQIEVSSAWKGHDLPFLAGMTLKSDFASVYEAPLQCMEFNIAVGTLLIIDDNVRIACIFETPTMFTSIGRWQDINNPMITFGCGFVPIDELMLDLDIVSSSFGTGLRPRMKYDFTHEVDMHLGFSGLHRSGSVGMNTKIDSFSLNIDLFYHLNLGFSWQCAFQYSIDNTR